MFDRMSYDITYRQCERVREVAEEPGISVGVKRVYVSVVAPFTTAFCKAHEAVMYAEGTTAAARRASRETIEELNPFYCETRTIVMAFFPDQRLPDTLYSQTTDTGTLTAITMLMSAVQSHASEEWAKEVLEGPFGVLAPKAIEALKGAISAAKALGAARQARAKAHRPAYDKYVVFKRVVRDSLGASSVQYQRLRLRRSVAKKIEQAEEAAPESGAVPPAEGGTVAESSAVPSTKAPSADPSRPPVSVKIA